MWKRAVAGSAGSLPPLAVGTMLLLCLAWGLNMVAVKLGNAGIPPVLQAGARSLVAALLVWCWCRWRGVSLAGWRGEALWPGLAAGLLFAVEFLMIFIGLQYTSAARAVLFLYAAPFFVAAGAHWLLPDDRLTPTRLAGLSLAFAGLLLAFGEKAQGGASSLMGDLLLLGAGLFWGATTVLVKASALRRAAPALVLQYQLIVSAVLLLGASPLLGETWTLRLTPLVGLAFAYQAIGIAFASYTAWFWLVGRYSASRLSAFSVLGPIFGVLAGALLLGEPLGPMLLAAMLLVAAGLWLVNRPSRQRQELHAT